MEGEERAQIQSIPTSTSIVHVKQKSSWDCGIACLQMVLQLLGKDVSCLDQLVKEMDADQSIWTVDLAYLLSKFSVPSTLYSTHLGVQEDYTSIPFYKRRFNQDKVRVERLMGECKSHGYECIQRKLTIDELSDKLVGGKCVIISLVDWNLMHCTDCSQSPSQMCAKMCSHLGRCVLGTYQGHFILLTDISTENDRVTFHNPGISKGPCFCSLKMFDTARTAVGTDEDLLVIERDT
ncbi:protein GUCD1-like [Watersipora subatra]|uniref:protein GUCD1-like n=1 Tax=Watersipora subatra TaxID=2589382 RepID=UPI00355C3168